MSTTRGNWDRGGYWYIPRQTNITLDTYGDITYKTVALNGYELCYKYNMLVEGKDYGFSKTYC